MDKPYGTDDILQRFGSLNVWRRKDERAPHKPLLALWAIAQCLRDEPRLIPFVTADAELTRLLKLFGPHRKTVRTYMPFWRMQKDGVWEIDRPELVRVGVGGDARVSDLKTNQIRAGLTARDYQMFQDDPHLAWRVAYALIESHFPASLHGDILRAAGFSDGPSQEAGVLREATIRYLPRDSSFRARVLDAYDGKCAVCQLSLHLRDEPIGLEAAHIQWHKSRGPARVCNGLALCVLHHKLFDLGAFTVQDDPEGVSFSTHRRWGKRDGRRPV